MRKLCVVTGTRAEYGLLYWLMKDIASDADLSLQVVVSGTHLSSRFGATYQQIIADGFAIDCKVPLSLDDDSPVGVCKALSEAVAGFATAFDQLKPDVVVLLGDRYEIFAAASAATLLSIPIAHIHGGESTAGAFDDSFRHAITKMATFHFTAAEEYRRCVMQMGEDPKRVFCVGAPGLDHLKRSQLLARASLEEKIGLTLRSPLFLVTYHPVTREKSTSSAHTQALVQALDAFPQATIIITGANADPDNAAIGEWLVSYAHQHNDRMRHVVSLGSINYLSLLQYADVVIGNSSSGVIEAPAFHKATVNIGDRQKGRLMAESIISCPDDAAAIQQAIAKALTPEFQKNLAQVQNPYGCGNASATIKSILKAAPLDNVLKKEFHRI